MKIGVGVVSHGDTVGRQFWESWFQTPWPVPIPVMSVAGRSPARGRNLIVQQTLDQFPEIEALLFIDNDQAWDKDVPSRLIQSDKDIVAAWAHMRYSMNGNRPPCVFTGRNPENGLYRINQPCDAGLERVDVVGFGMVLVKTAVFRKVPKPWFSTPVEGEDLIGEDVAFCQKAKAAGFEIWVDWSLALKHQVGGLMTERGKLVNC